MWPESSPCFHEVQDVLGSQALLLLVIRMWQELKPQLVHLKLVLFVSDTEGLLDINFLQHLEPDGQREPNLPESQGTVHDKRVLGNPRV